MIRKRIEVVTMFVEDLMNRNVFTTHPEMHVGEAVKIMNANEIGCLIVVKNENPVGIMTERDLLKRVLELGKPPQTIRVSDIMTSPIIYGEPKMEIEDAARLMFRKKVKKLPIMNDGKLVGLITLTDIARTAHMDQKMMNVIRELKDGGWLPPKRMEKIINIYATM